MVKENWARVERLALCDLLAETGPDAPTLCTGWTTGDLAAHLVIRERRPDAGPGILIPPLAGYTARVQRRVTAAKPFAELVSLLRQGPPPWSPMGLPGLDAAANTLEFFVHHEDVLRARPGWQPRELPEDMRRQLWRRLRMSRLVLRRVPVEITLVEPGGRTQQVTKGGKRVRVHGPVGELALWATGRKDAAQVELTGEAEGINVLTQSRWRL
jgi:uncharacterized protein (TIGR03085 family)